VAQTDNHIQASQKRLDLAIDGMTCGHCAEAVSRALSQCPHVAAVQVDLARGRAVVTGEGLRVDELVAAVQSAGYQAQPVIESGSG
jgi:copper chaperone